MRTDERAETKRGSATNLKLRWGQKHEGKELGKASERWTNERADRNENNATRGGSEYMKKSPANINCYAPVPLKHPHKSM